MTNECRTARCIVCHPPGRKREYLDAVKPALFGSAQHDRLQHFSEALQGMCGVWQVLNVAHVLPEGCLGVEGVVLQEVEVGEKLLDLILDWGAAERPPVLCLCGDSQHSNDNHSNNNNKGGKCFPAHDELGTICHFTSVR